MKRYFVYFAVLIWSIYAFEPPTVIDFSGFRAAVQHAVEKSQLSGLIKPLTEHSTLTDCHFPNSAIMLTLSTFYTTDQLAVQHKAMDVFQMKECIESRFVSVCLDSKCMDACKSNSINNCVLLDIETPASNFMENAFRFLMYLKHLLMYEALKVVDEVFFFDVDVLVFRNPFVDTAYPFQSDGSRDVNGKPYDMMWQGESFFTDCGGHPNGGQLFLRNSTRSEVYFKSLFSRREDFLSRSGPSDQEVLEQFVHSASLSSCTLPYTRFTAHPMRGAAFPNKTAPLSELVSFHASGATHNEKMKVLGHMLEGAMEYQSGSTSSSACADDGTELRRIFIYL